MESTRNGKVEDNQSYRALLFPFFSFLRSTRTEISSANLKNKINSFATGEIYIMALPEARKELKDVPKNQETHYKYQVNTAAAS